MDRKLDFSSIYGMPDIYVHSHYSTFGNALIQGEDDVRNGIIEKNMGILREALIKELEKERDFFIGLEAELFKKLKEKHKIEYDRETYKKYMKELYGAFQNEDTYASKLFILKKNLNTGKFNNHVLKFVTTVVEDIVSLKAENKIIDEETGKERKTTDKERKIIQEENRKTMNAIRKDLKDDIIKQYKKNFDKHIKYYQEAVMNMAPALNSLVEYLIKKYNANSTPDSESDLKKVTNTAVEKILSLMRTMPFWETKWEKNTGDTLKKDLKNFEKAIEDQAKKDPVEILKRLNIMKSSRWLDQEIENFQFVSLLGQIFETVIIDDLLHIITKKESKLYSLFLDGSDFSLLENKKWVDKTSTIDVQVNQFKTDKNLNIFYGWSAKLKEGESEVKLEETETGKFITTMKNNLSAKDAKLLDYIKVNITALQQYVDLNDKNETIKNEIKRLFNAYDKFERELVLMSMLVRFLIGWITLNKETGQYNAFSENKDANTINSIYFNSFIFTQEGIYSTVEMLEYFIDLLSGEKKEGIYDLINFSTKRNSISPQESSLEQLWKNKKSVLDMKIKNFSYNTFFEEPTYGGSIKTLMNDISKALSVPIYGRASLSLKGSSIKKIIK